MALKAIFLDRDGTLNRDFGYVGHPQQLEWLPQTLDALQRLQELDFDLYVISNQSGIARKKYNWNHLIALENQMIADLAQEQIHIQEWLYCPHLREISGHCSCRKPQNTMIEFILTHHPYHRGESWMIGDSPRDLEAGLASGLKVAGVQTGQKPFVDSPGLIFPNLWEFARALT